MSDDTYPNDAYTRWCVAHGVSHGHCPLSCEHPQPFFTTDGRGYCGRCWVVDRVLTEVVPCTPDVC